MAKIALLLRNSLLFFELWVFPITGYFSAVQCMVCTLLIICIDSVMTLLLLTWRVLRLWRLSCGSLWRRVRFRRARGRWKSWSAKSRRRRARWKSDVERRLWTYRTWKLSYVAFGCLHSRFASWHRLLARRADAKMVMNVWCQVIYDWHLWLAWH